MITKLQAFFTHGKKAWYLNHSSDQFVKKAKDMNYRSRACFKLLQINDKFHIFPKEGNVLDLGAAPGSWSQIIAEGHPHLKVVAVDLLDITAIPLVDFYKGDARSKSLQAFLKSRYQRFETIVSDMAPNFTGTAFQTHQQIVELNRDCLSCALNFSSQQLVMKTVQGVYEKALFMVLELFFQRVVRFKPKSSRSQSMEHYLICQKPRQIEESLASKILVSEQLLRCKNKRQMQLIIDGFSI